MADARSESGIPLLDSQAARTQALVASAATILVIALADWRVAPDASLGFLYLFPILVLALFAERWTILGVAVTCAVLREVFRPLPWSGNVAARVTMGMAAFVGAGLFVSELACNRRLALAHALQLREQIRRREEVEEELDVVVESSPAAILTLDGGARVLLANKAAHRLFGFDDLSLKGQVITPYLASLGSAIESKRPVLRTNMECTGRRRDGEVFLAHVWFSTYDSNSGRRLAAIVLDASEQLRDREVNSLGSLAVASRVLFGAVSHEVRNLSAAAAVAHANLSRNPGFAESEDFNALGALVEGLERIASSELRLSADRAVGPIDLGNVLDELRIVLEPSFREDGSALAWSLPSSLPRVLADHQALLQIFLNLAQNSQREMADTPDKLLRVAASCDGDSVVIRFEDSGPGVQRPHQLFKPFEGPGDSTGLGLFVSRTIARSFAGDILYEPRPRGSCFAVHLKGAAL